MSSDKRERALALSNRFKPTPPPSPQTEYEDDEDANEDDMPAEDEQIELAERDEVPPKKVLGRVPRVPRKAPRVVTGRVVPRAFTGLPPPRPPPPPPPRYSDSTIRYIKYGAMTLGAVVMVTGLVYLVRWWRRVPEDDRPAMLARPPTREELVNPRSIDLSTIGISARK